MPEPGPLVGRGRAADIYDIGGGRVLRRVRNGMSTEREAQVMQWVRSHGYPTPAVFDSDGPDLVMERIHGVNMLDAFASTPWRLRSWAIVLAGLHADLGDLPLPGFDLPNRFGAPQAIGHCDLHPGNVLLAPSGPVVIDWSNVGTIPRGADVAVTWVISATAQIDETGVVAAGMRAGRAAFLRFFLRCAGRDMARSFLADAAEFRLRDPNLRPSEPGNIAELLRREGLR